MNQKESKTEFNPQGLLCKDWSKYQRKKSGKTRVVSCILSFAFPWLALKISLSGVSYLSYSPPPFRKVREREKRVRGDPKSESPILTQRQNCHSLLLSLSSSHSLIPQQKWTLRARLTRRWTESKVTMSLHGEFVCKEEIPSESEREREMEERERERGESTLSTFSLSLSSIVPCSHVSFLCRKDVPFWSPSLLVFWRTRSNFTPCFMYIYLSLQRYLSLLLSWKVSLSLSLRSSLLSLLLSWKVSLPHSWKACPSCLLNGTLLSSTKTHRLPSQ